MSSLACTNRAHPTVISASAIMSLAFTDNPARSSALMSLTKLETRSETAR